VSGHLGDDVAAFVDGELDYARRERALAHLSLCARCRAAVDAERAVKTRVQTLPGAEPSAHLIRSLTRVPAHGAPDPVSPPVHLPGPHLPVPAGRAGRGGLLLAGVGSLAAGVIGVAYVVGAAGAVEPGSVTPPVARFSAEFAGSSEQSVPLPDPAMDMLPVLGRTNPVGGP
jgi:anti-sigma factor RsiW